MGKNWSFISTRDVFVNYGHPYVSMQEEIGECNASAFKTDEFDSNRFYNPKKWKKVKPKSALYQGQLDKVSGVDEVHMVEIYTRFYRIVQYLRKKLRSLFQSGIYGVWFEYFKYMQYLLDLHKSSLRVNLNDRNFIM